MLGFIIAALKIIFLLGFLVLIHELGHYVAARICKVKVNEFAIGWGPTIWKKTKNDTKYAIRLFPIGGFVNMEGEERRSEEEGSFSKASVPKRMLIIVAGAVVNILFALIVYFILSATNTNNTSLTISFPLQGSQAESSGLLPEDTIKEINNKKVYIKSDMDRILSKLNGEEIEVKVKRNNELLNFKFMPVVEEMKSIGIHLGTEGKDLSAEVKAIFPDSSAEKSGIQIGDKILKIDGIDTENDPYKVKNIIEGVTTSKTEIVLDRKGETKTIETEVQTEKLYYVGVILKEADKTFLNNVYYAFWDTRDFSISIVDNLKLLFSGKVKMNQLMGPIGISGEVAKTNGVKEFVYLLALISLSLGVTNLLPFPPLDGGRAVILLMEGIRKKPLKEDIEIKIQLIGFALIIFLAIYISYKDILRIF